MNDNTNSLQSTEVVSQEIYVKVMLEANLKNMTSTAMKQTTSNSSLKKGDLSNYVSE